MSFGAHEFTVNQWLAQLGDVGAQGLVLDPDGRLALELDDASLLQIELDPEQPVLYLHTDLLTLSEPDLRPALLERAMRLNLHTLATGGATLGLDDARGVLVMSIMRSLGELDPDRFLMLLDGFTRIAPQLRAELRALEPSGASVADAPALYSHLRG